MINHASRLQLSTGDPDAEYIHPVATDTGYGIAQFVAVKFTDSTASDRDTLATDIVETSSIFNQSKEPADSDYRPN